MQNSFLAIFAAVLACTTVVVAIPGTLMQQIGPLAAGDPATLACKAPGAACAPDCSTIMYCAAATGEPMFSQTCSSKDAKTPYCVNNACTDKPDTTNKQCGASTFTCTNDGIFPDATDCTKYHSCEAAGKDAELYVCDAGYVFSSTLNTCVVGRAIAGYGACQTIDCSRTTNAMVVYRANPSVYAFCSVKANGARETIMFRCPDEINQMYDLTTNTCVFNCKQQGNFMDRENCNGYISCTFVNGRLQPKKQACVAKYEFNPTTKQCTKETKACVSEIVPPKAA